jgi:haloacetate dehalogenase
MDAADEKAGRNIEAPLLILWGSKGSIGQLWNVLDLWRRHASGRVEGGPLEAGHYLAEEKPEEVLRDMLRFFG